MARATTARAPPGRSHVTVIGSPLKASDMAAIAGRVADTGGNIDRIERMARYPVTAIELHVSGTDPETLRTLLAPEAARRGIDVAVQPANLMRRGVRLIVMDVDSTLIQGEVIEMLAAHAGLEPEVAAITEAAMRGELDFEQSLRARVKMLAGVDAAALDTVYESIVVTPGARTMVRTLRRLGYRFAIVSGGFSQITDRLAADLGIHFSRANELEIVDGVLTGEIVGDVVDRAGKARALREFAEKVGVPQAATIAIGDGANDLDMLNAAGLGIAYNARPVVQEAADTTVNVPYLDTILYLLGISREEIEAADAEAGIVTPAPPSDRRLARPTGRPTGRGRRGRRSARRRPCPSDAHGPGTSNTAVALVGNVPIAISLPAADVALAVVESVGQRGHGRVVAHDDQRVTSSSTSRDQVERGIGVGRVEAAVEVGSRSQPAPRHRCSQVCAGAGRGRHEGVVGHGAPLGQPASDVRRVAVTSTGRAHARSRSGRPARPWRAASRPGSGSASAWGEPWRPRSLGRAEP